MSAFCDFNFRFILGLLFFIGKDRDQLLVELVDGRVRYSPIAF